jgi:aminoglycoside phosphotransferase (APT) family kinase protein
LLSTASAHRFASRELFEEKLNFARKMQSRKHAIVYTHGDLKHHNIMVYNGHLSGFIDWESAGWYPEYWEFITALRYCRKDFWWYDFVSRLGGVDYTTEQEIERALTSLTIDSYVW